MGRQAARIVISLGLIGLGVLILLSNLRILPFEMNVWQWSWVSVFGLGGVGFLLAFASSTHENWWAAIPGFTLLGLAGLIGLPAFWSELGGAFFLGMIGLSFWVIYFVRRDLWWAIIPGGVLLTLSAVAAASEQVAGTATGGFFFLGLGLTFLIVYLVPTSEGRMSWAIWPAGILGAMGLLIMIGFSGAGRFVWPIALVLAGGWLVLRAVRPRLQ